MKKILLGVAALTCFTRLFAQDEKKDERKGQFKKENIFIGGGINVGAGNGSFALGIIPEVGYSITKWLDGGIAFNLNYVSQNNVFDNLGYGPYRVRNFNYGGGPFLRVWPFDFLNIAIQPEYNWTKSKQQ